MAYLDGVQSESVYTYIKPRADFSNKGSGYSFGEPICGSDGGGGARGASLTQVSRATRTVSTGGTDFAPCRLCFCGVPCKSVALSDQPRFCLYGRHPACRWLARAITRQAGRLPYKPEVD